MGGVREGSAGGTAGPACDFDHIGRRRPYMHNPRKTKTPTHPLLLVRTAALLLGATLCVTGKVCVTVTTPPLESVDCCSDRLLDVVSAALVVSGALVVEEVVGVVLEDGTEDELGVMTEEEEGVTGAEEETGAEEVEDGMALEEEGMAGAEEEAGEEEEEAGALTEGILGSVSGPFFGVAPEYARRRISFH